MCGQAQQWSRLQSKLTMRHQNTQSVLSELRMMFRHWIADDRTGQNYLYGTLVCPGQRTWSLKLSG